MRSILFTLLLVGFCRFGGFSQTDTLAVDQRLIEVYGLQRVQELTQSQPGFIRYMNYYVQTAYEILYDVPAHKTSPMVDVCTLTNKKSGKPIQKEDVANLNVLFLDLKQKQDQYLSYRVGNTGMVVVFRSPEHILLDFNQLEKQRK